MTWPDDCDLIHVYVDMAFDADKNADPRFDWVWTRVAEFTTRRAQYPAVDLPGPLVEYPPAEGQPVFGFAPETRRARLLDQRLVIQKGRRSVIDRVGPQTVSFTLDNVDAVMSTGRDDSPFWPDLLLATPVRVVVNPTGFDISVEDAGVTGADTVEFLGEVSSYEYSWPDGDLRWCGDGGEARVTLACEGFLGRLLRGRFRRLSPIGAAVRASADDDTQQTTGWWPLLTNRQPVFFGTETAKFRWNDISFGGGERLPGGAPTSTGNVPYDRNQSTATGFEDTRAAGRVIPDPPVGAVDNVSVQAMVSIPAPVDHAGGVLLLGVHTSSRLVTLTIENDDVTLRVHVAGNATPYFVRTEDLQNFLLDGRLLETYILIRDMGGTADVQWTLRDNAAGGISYEYQGVPWAGTPVASEAWFPLWRGWSISDVTVAYSDDAQPFPQPWNYANIDECDELFRVAENVEDFTLEVLGDISQPVVQRGWETDLELAVRLAEATGGLLAENRSGHRYEMLQLLTRDRLAAPSEPAVTLDARRNEIANVYTPVRSIADVVNTVEVPFADPGGTIRRSNGASVNQLGENTLRVGAEVCTRDDAIDLAEWYLELGTTPDAKVSNLTVDFGAIDVLVDNPGIGQGFNAIDFEQMQHLTNHVFFAPIEGKIVRIVNLPTQHPDSTASIDLMIQGWRMVVGPNEWRVTFNTTPGRPWLEA